MGDFSTVTRKKLKHLFSWTFFAKILTSELCFLLFKIKNFFSFKDPIPDALKSLVVYQFTCAGCNSRYIGEKSRHFATRVKEHLSTDKIMSTNTRTVHLVVSANVQLIVSRL